MPAKIETREWDKDGYAVSTDVGRLEVPFLHKFLSEEAYWSPGLPLETLLKSIRHSMCFGLYHGPTQIGFARVITDHATFGYLADVFIQEQHRGKGLSKWLMECIMAHPELQGFRRWMLATRDAHGLYEKSGFSPLKTPRRFMEIVKPYRWPTD